MLDLTSVQVPTQSNGKIEFIDLSIVKASVGRKKIDVFKLKYSCEYKATSIEELAKKHNFILDKSFMVNQGNYCFWTIGKNNINGVPRAFAIQSLDGLYGAGKVAKMWKGENSSNKITSEATFKVLKDCDLVDDNTTVCLLDLIKLDTNLNNCNVFEIVLIKEKIIETIIETQVKEQTEEQETVFTSNISDDEPVVKEEVEQSIYQSF